MKIHTDPPPPRRNRTDRLTDQMRNLKPGQSVIVCPKTAHCLAMHLRYKGMESRRQKIDTNNVQVWAV